MRGTDSFQESLFTVRKLDDFVPAAHPLRPIREQVNRPLKRLDTALPGNVVVRKPPSSWQRVRSVSKHFRWPVSDRYGWPIWTIRGGRFRLEYALAKSRRCLLGWATDRPAHRLPGGLVALGPGRNRHCWDGARDPPFLARPPRLGWRRWARRTRILLAHRTGAIRFQTYRVGRRSGDLIRSWMISGESRYLKRLAP